MAKRSADGAEKPFSSKLMQMKFMQRSRQKEAILEHAAAQEAVVEDAKWVGGARRGCIVIQEGDPRPGALVGHMSFREFNPAAEKLQEEKEQQLADAARRAAARAAGGDDGKAVSDAELAAALRADRLEHDDEVRPWREKAVKRSKRK